MLGFSSSYARPRRVSSEQSVDLLVVGAGVTGVAVARALALRAPRLSIAVVEKEAGVARHTSGRNSGVAHAGFNPRPGTLKARFCVEGNRRIRAFCRERGVPVRDVGTLVVARSADEAGALEELRWRGEANDVPDLRLLSARELGAREPNVRGCAALLAPTGAVLDAQAYVEALARDAQERGVTFAFGTRVLGVETAGSGFRVLASDASFRCGHLVNAAGLQADRLAHHMGAGREFTIVPFRGEYHRVAERKANLVRAMVYPLPDPDHPFLGIHLTPTAGGQLRIGPNAVLALGRESYRPWQVHPGDVLALASDPRAWRLLTPSFVRTAVGQLRTSLSRHAFLREASTLVRGLELADLEGRFPAGNRAQLVDRRGRLVDDLVVERDGTTLHILNVVSPGLTCSLPFADHLVDTFPD